MSALKVVVAGPKGTGKTVVSNFLAGQSETLDVEKYDETAGARILEMEQQVVVRRWCFLRHDPLCPL